MFAKTHLNEAVRKIFYDLQIHTLQHTDYNIFKKLQLAKHLLSTKSFKSKNTHEFSRTVIYTSNRVTLHFLKFIYVKPYKKKSFI